MHFLFQILYNLYSALLGHKCTCVRHIRYQIVETAAIDDTRVYTFENGEYQLYKLVQVDRNSVSALRIKTRPWEPLLRVPDFGAVGVFETDGTTSERLHFEKSQIKGKVIMVGQIAVTIPRIILDEAV